MIFNNIELEVKEDSYGNPLFRVKPPKRNGLVVGWFPTEQEAIDAFNTYQK